MNSTRTLFLLLNGWLVFLLVACSGTASNPSPSPTAEEVRPTRTPRPTVDAGTSPTAAPTSAPAPTAAAGSTIERLPVTNTGANLSAVGNLQIEMKIDGVIKTEGQADEEIRLVFREMRLQNGDRSLTMDSEKPDTDLSRVVYIQIGNQAYQYTEKGSKQNCLNMSGGSPLEGGLLTPEAFLGELKEAKLVERGVQVNGFTTDRYSFTLTEQSLGYQGQANGEIWVSNNPSVVVRHIGEINGIITSEAVDDSGVPLPNSLSNLRWEYNITKVADNATITLPELCAQQQAASADIPLPPNVSNQLRMGDLISFETTDSATNIAAFYRTEMSAKGWKAGEEVEYDGTFQLSFTKDGREAAITISTADNKTTVIILLSSS